LGAILLTAMTVAVGLGGATASAKDGQHRVVVTPENMQGWSCVPPTADTRFGGHATFVVDPTAPSGRGALELTTDVNPASKVQCAHSTQTALVNITELSYWTKQIVPPTAPAIGDPAYQLATCLTGASATGCNLQSGSTTKSSFTTLVFEPYQNPLQGPVLPNVWQKWDVDAGLFWSTRTVVCSNGTVVGTPGGPATYTLSALKEMCPEALVFQFLVNVGTNNPLYQVRTDLFNFNGTVYDFEPSRTCDKGQSNHDGDKKNCGNHGGNDGDHEGDADD